jgi:hypothetical protein
MLRGEALGSAANVENVQDDKITNANNIGFIFMFLVNVFLLYIFALLYR